MQTYSNTTPSGASQTIAPGTAFISGAPGTIGFFLFQVTAQDLTAVGGGANIFINVAERTSSTCYMRGFAENMRIQTSTGLPWFHRRICFCSRGGTPFNTIATGDSPIQPSGNSVDTTNGMQRLWKNSSINAQPNTIAAQYEYLFKGTSGVDWSDVIVAPVDTSRVDLKFDKTWTIKSGNQLGTVIERKLWHTMNKNIVYNDDESGEAETSSYFSVADKRGMGDYYILDLITPGLGGTSSDLMNIFSNSTLYWHER